MMTSTDVVHLVGGVAMTHILLLVAFPGALSVAMTYVTLEYLLFDAPSLVVTGFR
jgi:hypothetical protein